MSVFSANMHHRSFYWQLSMLCFVLGLLLAAAWHTNTTISRSGVTRFPNGVFYAMPDNSSKYEAEIKTQRERIAELENTLADRGGAAETLNKELQNFKGQLAITDIEGDGVQITLEDSKKTPLNPTDQINQSHLIHDYDIGSVVNELKAAGAEAIAVNNQRVALTTAIRCVGPTIMVNGQRIAPPVVVRAIGDPNTLFAGLDMIEGVLDKIRKYDPAMARIERRTKMRLPAFTGGMQFQYGRPITKPSEDSEKSKKERRK